MGTLSCCLCMRAHCNKKSTSVCVNPRRSKAHATEHQSAQNRAKGLVPSLSGGVRASGRAIRRQGARREETQRARARGGVRKGKENSWGIGVPTKAHSALRSPLQFVLLGRRERTSLRVASDESRTSVCACVNPKSKR